MAGRRMGTKRPETTRRAVLCTDRRWSYACWLFGLGKRLRLFPLRVRVGWLMVLLAVNTWRGSMVMIRKREREGEEESAEAVEIILRIASSLVFSGPKGTRSVAPRKSARLMKMFPCPRHKHVPFPRWKCFARLVPRIRFPRPREEKKQGLRAPVAAGRATQRHVHDCVGCLPGRGRAGLFISRHHHQAMLAVGPQPRVYRAGARFGRAFAVGSVWMELANSRGNAGCSVWTRHVWEVLPAHAAVRMYGQPDVLDCSLFAGVLLAGAAQRGKLVLFATARAASGRRLAARGSAALAPPFRFSGGVTFIWGDDGAHEAFLPAKPAAASQPSS